MSVPITNEAGILQVSPGDGLAGLTRRLARTTARPERYYPSGRRTFVRLVSDDLEAARRVVGRMEAIGGSGPRVPRGLRARPTLVRIEPDQKLPNPAPVALWGYESMRLVLDAVRRSGAAHRGAVVRAGLAFRVRRSPLGTDRVRPSGAVDGLGPALYRLEGERFEMARELR